MGGAAYDPALDRWRLVPDVGAPLGRGHFPLVWTGRAVLAWGGYGSESLGWGEDASVLDGGGLWDPSSGTWQTMAWPSRPTRRAGHTAVWTGDDAEVSFGLGEVHAKGMLHRDMKPGMANAADLRAKGSAEEADCIAGATASGLCGTTEGDSGEGATCRTG